MEISTTYSIKGVVLPEQNITKVLFWWSFITSRNSRRFELCRLQKLSFFRQIADQLNIRLKIRQENVFINLVFIDREDWSFGNGEPW